jgi:hypothetical protein
MPSVGAQALQISNGNRWMNNHCHDAPRPINLPSSLFLDSRGSLLSQLHGIVITKHANECNIVKVGQHRASPALHSHAVKR